MPEPVRLMLVEDNEDDYEATMRSLRKNHFVNPVHWCRTGQDALDYLYRQSSHAGRAPAENPDLILLDLNMPGVDGRQVLTRIKEDPVLRSIPVIVLTTSADENDIEGCYAIGANTYVQKPVHFDGLTEAIGRIKDYWFGIAILPPQAAVM